MGTENNGFTIPFHMDLAKRALVDAHKCLIDMGVILVGCNNCQSQIARAILGQCVRCMQSFVYFLTWLALNGSMRKICSNAQLFGYCGRLGCCGGQMPIPHHIASTCCANMNCCGAYSWDCSRLLRAIRVIGNIVLGTASSGCGGHNSHNNLQSGCRSQIARNKIRDTNMDQLKKHHDWGQSKGNKCVP